ncbi:MAG TPA: 2-C-methyl-D-erythritol 4-phosphate cytidylyltransferase, partial [Halieaceae bacterium]|nr:2-C-methyl-D-erythritol 4-phosphate cytidylyltransferase [Halieaceae bacterium]
MGYSQPKQHVLLGGKTLLQRSLQALLGLPGMQGVVIAFAPDDPRAADYRDTDERVRIVQG